MKLLRGRLAQSWQRWQDVLSRVAQKRADADLWKVQTDLHTYQDRLTAMHTLMKDRKQRRDYAIKLAASPRAQRTERMKSHQGRTIGNSELNYNNDQQQEAADLLRQRKISLSRMRNSSSPSPMRNPMKKATKNQEQETSHWVLEVARHMHSEAQGNKRKQLSPNQRPISGF